MALFKRSAFKPSKTKYFTYYNARSRRKSNISASKVKSGYICELNYTKFDERIKVGKYGSRVKLTKPQKYMILILHPDYHGYMHALKITNIRPVNFKKWIKKIGIKISKKRKFVIFNFKFPKVKMSKKQAKQFYNRNIKPYIKTTFEDSYRTFRIDRLRDMKVIDFDFDNL